MRLLNADELKEALLIEAGQDSDVECGKDWSLTGDQVLNVIDHLQDVKFAYICDKTRCEKCIYPWCKKTSDIEHAAHFKKVYENIYYEINDQTVDAVEVVRCEDCKHFKELPNGNDGVCWRDNKRDYYGIYGVVNGKWYCADGKRREENEAD